MVSAEDLYPGARVKLYYEPTAPVLAPMKQWFGKVMTVLKVEPFGDTYRVKFVEDQFKIIGGFNWRIDDIECVVDEEEPSFFYEE
mgnify:CR=1 FL=1